MHFLSLFASCVLALPAVQAAVLERSTPNQCTPYKCILNWSGAPAWCASQSKAHSTCTKTVTATSYKPICTKTVNTVATSTVTAPTAVTTTVPSTSTVTSTVVTTTTVAGVPTDSYATCTQVLPSAMKRAAGPEPRNLPETEERRSAQPPSCLLGLSWSQCNQACQCGGCHGSGCGTTVTKTCTEVKPAPTCTTATQTSKTTVTVSSTVTTTAVVATTTTVTTSTSTELTPAEPTNRFYIQAQLSTDPSGSSSGFLGSTGGGNPIVDLEPFSASLASWSLDGVIQGAGSMNADPTPGMIWEISADASNSVIYTQIDSFFEVITCSIDNCILSCQAPQVGGTVISNTVGYNTRYGTVLFYNNGDPPPNTTPITMHIVTYQALAGGS